VAEERPDRRSPVTGPPLLGSVRVRLAVSAMVVVAITLALGGAGLVWLLHRSLIHGLASRAAAEAGDVASLAAEGSLPTRLPLRPSVAAQVVDGHGRPLAASPELLGRPPISDRRPAVGTTVTVPAAGVLAASESDIVVATAVNSPAGVRYVYAVVSDDPADDSAKTVALLLVVALPLLALAAGGFAWVLAGRALRPVEAIRTEVGDITASDLHRRVSESGSNDEIGRLARTMNAMLARLEAASDQQRRFVSDASHELRSPLAALLAQLEVARAHPGSANWPEVAGAVGEEADRLWHLVDDLLLLARGDEGHLVPRHEAVDLDDLVLAEGNRLRAQGRVAVDLRSVSAGRVSGDREQLRRVVRNLADNAEHHAVSAIAFEVHADGPWVEVVVADDGPGIPPEERGHIFERFARLDEGRGRHEGGTGLGLAIVGAVVGAHGGTVEVADSPRGARIVVRLPVEEDSGPPTPGVRVDPGPGAWAAPTPGEPARDAERAR